MLIWDLTIILLFVAIPEFSVTLFSLWKSEFANSKPRFMNGICEDLTQFNVQIHYFTNESYWSGLGTTNGVHSMPQALHSVFPSSCWTYGAFDIFTLAFMEMSCLINV